MFVIPAKAGTQLSRSWAPAYAGVTNFLFAIALFVLALATPAAAQTFPKLTGRVVDQANLLSPAQEVDLSSKSSALEAQTGRQFVVATVNSLEGRTIEDYGYRLGRQWQIGRKGEDDGVILVIAPNERKVRIETGYGARVFLTDAVSSLIVRNAILPQFRKNPPDYGAGIVAGADAVIQQMSLPPEQAQRNIAQAERQQAAQAKEGAGFLPIIVIMIIFFVIVGSLSRRVRGRRYRRRRGDGISPWIILWGLDALSQASRGRGGGGGWGGGGWGGGGGGFGGFSGGGGSFGGGGASGSW